MGRSPIAKDRGRLGGLFAIVFCLSPLAELKGKQKFVIFTRSAISKMSIKHHE